MSRYRRVEVGTWRDRRFRELTPQPPSGRTLWLYLLCGERTTIFPGLVIAREMVIADDFGWSLADTRGCWKELHDRGMALADWAAGLIVLPKALLDSRDVPRETARPSSPNAFRGWGKAWSDVPDCELKDAYLSEVRRFAEALGDAYTNAFDHAFPRPLEGVSLASLTASRPARVPDPDPVPDSGSGVGRLGSEYSIRAEPPAGPRADRDQPPVDRGGARAAGGRVPPAPPVADVQERSRPPVPHAPLDRAAAAADDVRERQRLVERFRAAMAEARRKAAAAHFMTGVRFELTLHGGENETELRQRLKDAGPNAESELEHVIAVATAEAMAKPDSVQWLGWSLGRSRSWDRALQTPIDTAGGGAKKSVFDVVDETVAKLEREREEPTDDGE